MKRTTGIVLFLCAVVTAFIIFSRAPESSTTETTSQPAKESVAVDKVETPVISTPRPRHAKGDASESTPNNVVVHTVADFANGERENLVIADGALQLGDDPSFVPRLKPYKRFGIFISPEHSVGDNIDTVTPNLDVTPFEDNEVTFEIRTKSADGVWSVWQEMTQEPNKPMRLETPGIAWQYRLTFFANDPNGPKVRSVSMSGSKTEVPPDPGANFSANNAN